MSEKEDDACHGHLVRAHSGRITAAPGAKGYYIDKWFIRDNCFDADFLGL